MMWFLGWLERKAQKQSCVVFRVFLTVLLVQFAILSFFAVPLPEANQPLPVLEAAVSSISFWWGVLSMYGALVLAGELFSIQYSGLSASGYIAVVSSLILLTADFLMHGPPMHAGAIMTGTALGFTGVLAYERFRRSGRTAVAARPSAESIVIDRTDSW
jgi:uncharacterized membrane protein YoaK (UPF0700 family)